MLTPALVSTALVVATLTGSHVALASSAAFSSLPLRAGNEDYAQRLVRDTQLFPLAPSSDSADLDWRGEQFVRRDVGGGAGHLYFPLESVQDAQGIDTASFYGPEGYLYMTVFGAQAETYTLSTSDLSVSSQGSGVTGQLRVTVVNNDEDCEAIKTRFDMWQDADDVWSQELFSQGFIVQGTGAACFDASNATFVASTTSTIPQGPYVASVNDQGVVLSKVYRVYHDEMQAFTTPAVPDKTGSMFYPLSAHLRGMNTMSIPVPSRVYTMNMTDARPLEGMRVAVKDIFDLNGFKTGCGNRAHWLLYAAANESATSVQRLVDLGAVIVGKVKTAQFANGAAVLAGWFDQMCPYNPRGDGYQSPSTSSSGSGAALAAYNWLDYTIGSDTGGSVRYPAGACGLIGFRPSWGALSLEGVMPMASRLDTAGFFARSGDYAQRFGRAWYAGDGIADRSYEGFPTRIRVPSDLIPMTSSSPAYQVLSEWVTKFADYMNATVDTTSYYGQWNETFGQQYGDLPTYANTSWSLMAG